MIKRILGIFFAILILPALTSNVIAVSEENVNASFTVGDTKYYISDQECVMDVAPYVKDGRTFLPLRFAANAVGISNENISWDPQTKLVTLKKNDLILEFQVDSNTMKQNNSVIDMDVKPEVQSGRVMLPIRWLAQSLGLNTAYNPSTRTVNIVNT